jgi:SagB-type dehydrogenase family enzyme
VALKWMVALLALGAVICAQAPNKGGNMPIPVSLPATIDLPNPIQKGRLSLEELLAGRRSRREFSGEPLTDEILSQLLWAAQGVTDPEGYRTAPSAGALYPLETYLATAEGFHHYEPRQHRLRRLVERDLHSSLYKAALEQDAVREAPAVFVIAAVYQRTARKYGESRSPRYVHLEAGHAAQNLLLQAVALGLGAVPLGAFHDGQVQKALGFPAELVPLYLVPVGRTR